MASSCACIASTFWAALSFMLLGSAEHTCAGVEQARHSQIAPRCLMAPRSLLNRNPLTARWLPGLSSTETL